MASSSDEQGTPRPQEGDEEKGPRQSSRPALPPSGFGGLSRRRGKKPIIAAVNGLAHGGGCEIIANVDLVFASPAATFALPEAKRGVVAMAGALPRLPHIIGRMRAMEMALTGRDVSAREATTWGLCTAVADAEGSGAGVVGGVVELAVRVAQDIAGNSPDSVRVSKEAVDMAWEGIAVNEASDRIIGGLWKGLEGGENIREGLKAFVEKRRPRWVDSKL